MAILFLELDDEITTAVGRLREAGDRTVALVLPAGSRIASSRINFRLLAREAGELGTELAIVAPEATARALASAAGLPTYGTVGRYEAAMAGGGGPEVAEVEEGGLEPGLASGDAPTVVGIPTVHAPPSGPLPVMHRPRTAPAFAIPRLPGAPLVIALILVVLLGAGTAAGVYFVLPEAHVTVTPKLESFGPVVVQVTADPNAVASNASAGVVPAAWVETTVDASDTFPATGIKVTEAKATGSVTFTWRGNQTGCRVAAGTTVQTRSGVKFQTKVTVVVPAATLSGTPGVASVAIEAAKAGTEGNVAAGAITAIPTYPKGCTPHSYLTVTNPKATTGGSHSEAKIVQKSDYDSAVSALQKRMRTSFDEWLAAGPTGTTGLLVQPDSAVLDDPIFDLAATDVVGKTVDTFDLAGNAAGRVLTVDPKDLTKIGTDRFPAAVPAGYTLAGAVAVTTKQVDSADPAMPHFEVTATGRAYRSLDSAALKRLILGKPIDQARAALGTYGEATVTLAPDWFGTIPQLDWRVSVEVLVPAQAT